MADQDLQREAEQRYLDAAHGHLDAMLRRAAAAADDAALRARDDWNAAVAHAHLTERAASMHADHRPLCFGRIDGDGAERWYIGRRHVEDGRGDPAVVDWRAPVAVPFYRATFRDPLDLRLRRRFILDGRSLVDLLDEDFDDPDSASHTSAGGVPDPLLAELGRSRQGVMHDIVATIAAEQDRIIRAPLDAPVVVQGGPGTGKTAIGLHRAAFLLYEHRVHLERHGVLVLGPNPLFLAYISQVLPSLGEVAVVQTTLPGLVGTWRIRGEDTAAVAALKGDGRMAAVLAAAGRAALTPVDSAVEMPSRWGSVTIPAGEVRELMDAATASGGTLGQQRSRFRRALSRRAVSTLVERRPEAVIDADDIAADHQADRPLQRLLNRWWPALSAPALVQRLLARPKQLATAADGILTLAERELLHRAAGSSLSAEAWTEADLALLDEAHSQLAGSPRRYGHIVVDEAQDLSTMALRMVARRSLDGRSLTILGDLAQATAPGAVARWDHAVDALGSPAGAAVEVLTVGYRVPRQIMEVANRLLAGADPPLPATTSVRGTDDPPHVVRAAPGTLATAVAARAGQLLAGFASVAVIAGAGRLGELQEALAAQGVASTPPGRQPVAGQVALLDATHAKGLEFDATVVVEPAELLARPERPGLLYIALTRAVQHLSMVHERALPPALA